MFINTENFGSFDYPMSDSFGSATSDGSYYSRDSNLTPSWTGSMGSAFSTPENSPNCITRRISHLKTDDDACSEKAIYGGSIYANPNFNLTSTPGFYNNSLGHEVPALSYAPGSYSFNVPETCVQPSQTTYADLNYTMQTTPLQLSKLDFHLDYSQMDNFTHNMETLNAGEYTRNSNHAKAISTANLEKQSRRRIRRYLHASSPAPKVHGSEPVESPLLENDNLYVELKIDVDPRSTQKCLFHGCGKSFRRLEHLKRHERTTHHKTGLPCEICNKSFNGRADNLKAHMLLHAKLPADRTKSCRTVYDPRAEGYLALYASKSRKGRSPAIAA